MLFYCFPAELKRQYDAQTAPASNSTFNSEKSPAMTSSIVRKHKIQKYYQEYV